MSSPPERNAIIDPNNPGRKRHSSLSDHFSGERFDQNEVLKHVILKLHLRSISHSGSTTPQSESEADSESFDSSPLSAAPDYSSSLSDELLLNVFRRISEKKQHLLNSLVCKRWCVISGKLIRSIKVMDWEFLASGRLSYRFPNLVDVNLVLTSINFERNSGILLSSKLLEIFLNSDVLGNDGLFVRKDEILDSREIDRGLKMLAEGCRNLRRIAMINVSEEGLGYLANKCELLQEMELHYCGDLSLKGVSKFRNLQILKLIGRLGGVYDSVVSDIGMTLLAQGCGRLVKLELIGCEGSYDGIKAIGKCCQMLEGLTLCNHKMEGGWLSALSYCGNLKTLSIQSCKYIDENPGQVEHLGSCPMLEELHLRRCHMRDEQGVKALFLVCRIIRVLEIEDCWGFGDWITAHLLLQVFLGA